MNKITIGLDAMGGDNAPVEIIKGAIDYSNENKNVVIVLFGDGEKIQYELAKYQYDKDLIRVTHTNEVIHSNEVPTVAIKSKKDSSMVVGLKSLKAGEVDAFVSAGSTGALLAGATLIVGRIKGIERPALATLLPNEKGFTFLIDSGANVDCKPTYLEQFAKMGYVYMQNIFGVKEPKVGLVNIGQEREKGNALSKETYALLENSNVNFVGNVEARDISKGNVDVLVCDGFVGNIILKLAEGLSKTILYMIKTELKSRFIFKFGALLCTPAFKNLKSKFDYSEVGGAPFLGLKALVVKAHGSSNSKDIKGAISQCVRFNEQKIIEKIQEMI